MAYIVIRLVPAQPVDGLTFTTYLDGLQLQVYAADTAAGVLKPLSQYPVYYSPMVAYLSPSLNQSGPYNTFVTVATAGPTKFIATGNYGTKLTFDSTDGITIGSQLYSTDPNSPINKKVSSALTVTAVDEITVTLNNNIPAYLPAGTVLTFVNQSPSTANPWAGGTALPFNLPTSGPATTLDGATTPTADNPLLVLPFTSSTGISGVIAGMSASDAGNVYIPAGTTVTAVDVTNSTVILSNPLTSSPPNNTLITFTLNPPFLSFSLQAQSSGSVTSGTQTFGTLTLVTAPGASPPPAASGVSCGMLVTCPSMPNLIPPGTTVTGSDGTTVTLSQPLNGTITANTSVNFTFPLSNGIVQHLEEIIWFSSSFFSWSLNIVITPLAVATAVIPLNSSWDPAVYTNVSVLATRYGANIPIDQIYYNVLVVGDDADTLSTPLDYMGIPDADTALYIELPPPPGTRPIALELPTDGTPPPFDDLYTALANAVTVDPILTATYGTNPTDAQIEAAIIGLAPVDCQRLAYEIAWSSQVQLPAPPDPLYQLYTNPYYGSDGNLDPSNDQDRQKFEGTLGSFYATRNAEAVRLTKFIAAVSAAILCEQLERQRRRGTARIPRGPVVHPRRRGRERGADPGDAHGGQQPGQLRGAGGLLLRPGREAGRAHGRSGSL